MLSKRDFLKKSLCVCGTIGMGFCGIKTLSGESADGMTHSEEDLPQVPFRVPAMYSVTTPKGIKCLLCPNECKVMPGETSECRTRVNNNGTLECIAYGNPCAVHVDPVEKKPLYHFLPSTDALSIATAGCNLACLNCQNWEISQTSPLKTKNYDLMPEAVVNLAVERNCRSIAYTYSDPVVFYEYVLDTARIARKRGIRNIIVSAGYIYENPLREWAKYIDAANIDLKSFSNEIYEMLNAGKLDPVLETLRILKEEGVWLEITNLIVPDWTDDQDMIREMCNWLYDKGFKDTPLHFSRFFPQYKLADLSPTPMATLKRARQIALESGLNYVYIGNAPELGGSTTNCPQCGHLLIERIGFSIRKIAIVDGNCESCGASIPGHWN